jgi:hypothetical protein
LTHAAVAPMAAAISVNERLVMFGIVSFPKKPAVSGRMAIGRSICLANDRRLRLFVLLLLFVLPIHTPNMVSSIIH